MRRCSLRQSDQYARFRSAWRTVLAAIVNPRPLRTERQRCGPAAGSVHRCRCLVLQSSYSGGAKLIIARRAPQLVSNPPLPETPPAPARPAPSIVQVAAAAEAALPQATLVRCSELMGRYPRSRRRFHWQSPPHFTTLFFPSINTVWNQPEPPFPANLPVPPVDFHSPLSAPGAWWKEMLSVSPSLSWRAQYPIC